jgi:prephenate dehydrogenase
MKKIGIIGTGLIGGSYGLALRRTGKYKIYAFDRSASHLKTAIQKGLADEVLTDGLYSEMDGIILAVPVNVLPGLAVDVLNKTGKNTWIFDTGSIKSHLARKIKNHPQRKRFVLSHPIAGTEYSGPEAAREDLFENKINIICDADDSDPEILKHVVELHEDLKMINRFLNAGAHDKHIAYVSHLSHVSSFLLGKTVMDVEKDEQNIFLMAGSGFASTVRLAKSSPDTWTPIFLENKEALLEVLRSYIENLNKFVTLLEQNRSDEIKDLLNEINRIGKIIDGIK